MNEHDRNLILLLYSDELSGEAKSNAELLIQSNADAKDYWDELVEINSIVSNSIGSAHTEETRSTNLAVDSLARNAILAELGPESNEITSPTIETKKTPNPAGLQFMFYVTASVAVLLASVSVFKILESSPNRIANTSDDASNSVTNKVSENPESNGNAPSPKKKRKKIRIKSDLLAKIQNTRSKIKSFKKRMEKRS